MGQVFLIPIIYEKPKTERGLITLRVTDSQPGSSIFRGQAVTTDVTELHPVLKFNILEGAVHSSLTFPREYHFQLGFNDYFMLIYVKSLCALSFHVNHCFLGIPKSMSHRPLGLNLFSLLIIERTLNMKFTLNKILILCYMSSISQ